MADNQELFRLVLEIQGQERVAKLATDVATAERELADMASAASLMGASLPVAQMAELANRIAGLKGQLSQAEGQVNAFGNAEAAAAAKAEQAAARTEAAAQRKVAAAEKAAQAARKEAAAADMAATRRAVADDKAMSVGSRGTSADRDIEARLKRASGAGDAASGGGGLSGRLKGLNLAAIGGTLDDLQYVPEMGLRPILNNIMAIAPAAGIALLAVSQIYTHWGDLMGLMGTGIPQPALTGPELLAANLKKASDEMEALQKKSSLTWFELEKLNKLKGQVAETKQAQKNEAAVESILETPAKAVKEQGDAFKKAVDVVGGKNALGEIKGNLEGEKDSKGLVFNVVQRKMTTPDQAAKDLLRAATEGDEIAQAEIKKGLASNSVFGKAIESNRLDTTEEKDRKEEEFFEQAEQNWRAKMEADLAEREAGAQADEEKRLDVEAKQNEKIWDESVKEASRTKEFLEKPNEELTPAELEAKRQYEQRQAGKRAERAEKDRMDAPGLDDFVRDAIFSGADPGELDAQLAAMGFGPEESGDLIGKGTKAAFDKSLKETENAKSTTIQGGQALRDAIQGGVGADVGQKQLERLRVMEGYLQRIAEQQPDYTARTT